MKTVNITVIITIIFCLIASMLVIFFIFQEGRTEINTIAAVDDAVISGKVENEYNKSFPDTVESRLNLLFFGDIMLDRNVKNKINRNGLDYLIASSTLEQLSLSNFDMVSANLEGAVTKAGEHFKPIYSNDFAFSPVDVLYLKNIGFNYFTIANNHLADQGERGIIETRENLQKLDINYSGCEDRKVSECSYKILEINGKKVGMVGLSMVYGQFNSQQADGIIKTLVPSTDLIIVNVHWGTEYQHQFSKLQQTTAHELIDAGADVIIGHHPHVVQGIEIYNGKPIFYSLGNFIFDQYFSADTQAGLGVGMELSTNKNNILLLPLKSKSSQVSLMPVADKVNFFKKFISWSKIDFKYKEQISNGELFLN